MKAKSAVKQLLRIVTKHHNQGKSICRQYRKFCSELMFEPSHFMTQSTDGVKSRWPVLTRATLSKQYQWRICIFTNKNNLLGRQNFTTAKTSRITTRVLMLRVYVEKRSSMSVMTVAVCKCLCCEPLACRRRLRSNFQSHVYLYQPVLYGVAVAFACVFCLLLFRRNVLRTWAWPLSTPFRGDEPNA